jgi:hypothetical protein
MTHGITKIVFTGVLPYESIKNQYPDFMFMLARKYKTLILMSSSAAQHEEVNIYTILPTCSSI